MHWPMLQDDVFLVSILSHGNFHIYLGSCQEEVDIKHTILLERTDNYIACDLYDNISE